MRDERSSRAAAADLDEPGTAKLRTASIRFPFLSRKRAGLFAASILFLAGIPLGEPPSGSRPARRVPSTTGVAIRRLATGVDGRTIATVDEPGRVSLRAVVEEAFPERPLDAVDRAQAVAFAPDGRSIVVGTAGLGNVVFSLPSAEETLNRSPRAVDQPARIRAGRPVAGGLELFVA